MPDLRRVTHSTCSAGVSTNRVDGATVSLADVTTLRVAMAQSNPVVGDLAGNRDRILADYRAALEAGCDLVVFGELSITGYPPEDLVLKPGFVRDNRAVLDDIAAATGDCVAVIGFVDRSGDVDPATGRDVLFNAAAVCSHGVVRSVYHKRTLPNYDVFDEERTFHPGGGSYHLHEIAGVVVGVSICEDVWFADGPVSDQARGGARLNVNINGSPFHAGKVEERRLMLAERARDNHCAIVYVNQVGGQDELVFDGASMIVDATGELIARSPQYRTDLSIVDLELGEDARPVSLPVTHISSSTRSSGPRIEPIVAPVLDERAELYEALVLGTRDYVTKNRFTDVVIGLSGGIDSSLVACVAVDALGADHVHGVAMPSRYSSQGSIDDAYALADALGIDIRTISIEPAFQSYLDMLEPSFLGRDPDLTEENLQSRCRGQILMALSNKFGWMVLTTGNKSELAVGYFTIYGDSVGGYAVIKDLLKTEVFALSRHVNERAGREIVPESVLTKPPSAELRPDQRDDQSLPPYDILDPILELYVERDLTAAEIVERGHDEEVVRRIARLVDLNEYKRRQCPPGVRVSPKAFGKDRRLPITNGYRG